MIVDIHTHIFPPAFIANREDLAHREPKFAALYADPKAKMATAGDLMDSMTKAKVDVSVACGFWWDDPALAAEHTTYIVDAARTSGGRIVAFPPTFAPPAGASGSGEVRIDDPASAPTVDRPILVHCSEDVGHEYPGKAGGLTPGGLWRLMLAQPQARVIAGHWGGGMPFFGLMPEVRALIDADRLIFDSAASSLLYRPAIFKAAVEFVGVRAIAWGSDFPLRSQSNDLGEVRAAITDAAAREAILGGNAARFLGLRA